MGGKMPDKYSARVSRTYGILWLEVTSNGFQWSAIRIDNPRKEIPQIIEALQAELEKEEK